MKFKITQLEPDGVVIEEKTIKFDNKDNQLFDFKIVKDKDDKFPVFYHMPIKGRIKASVGERGEGFLNLHDLVLHFTLSKYFDNDVLTNGRRLIVYRREGFLNAEILMHIEKGCLGREYTIEKGRDDEKFKIIITL